MESYRLRRQSDGGQCVGVPYRGSQLFAQPTLNKGSAFTREERKGSAWMASGSPQEPGDDFQGAGRGDGAWLVRAPPMCSSPAQALGATSRRD
jgi:hypothetical protein